MIKKVRNALYKLINNQQAAGLLLILCLLLSLLIANSGWNHGFINLLSNELGFEHGVFQLKLPLLSWINDGLMAIFFFFIGLEIKQELLTGHLSGFKKAAVPVFAAIGGVIFPAAIFALFNNGKPTGAGWGIPMATDIAFALGILSLLGKLVPSALKAFLSALAVVDDLLAILVIALFYSTELHTFYLISGLGIFSLLLILNKLGVKPLVYYIVPGVLMWYFIHHSGIHATIAGVLTAAAIPYDKEGHSLNKLTHALAAPVNFIIMPVFAIANTNIHFETPMLKGLFEPLSLGILFGLILGKPIGITLFAWLCVKFKAGVLPAKLNWKYISGAGLLGGIGFTMSIFVSVLSFGASAYNTNAKFAVLIASTIAGLAGYLYLRKTLKDNGSTKRVEPVKFNPGN